MELFIKNMVCPRCIEAVKIIFKETQIATKKVELGKVLTIVEIDSEQMLVLKDKLTKKGFELLGNKQAQLVNQVKSIVIDEIHHQKESSLRNFSKLFSEKTGYDYNHLSRLFSTSEGQTIEKYILLQKIEKVKELLTYDELTLSEIAFQMNYSSSAHLSAQFKKIVRLTPTAFKKEHSNKRNFLDDL